MLEKVFIPQIVWSVVVFTIPVNNGSVSVTYLFQLHGVPVVPTRASFSPCVGTRASLSPTEIGIMALTGATESLESHLVAVLALGAHTVAVSSTYFLVAI